MSLCHNTSLYVKPNVNVLSDIIEIRNRFKRSQISYDDYINSIITDMTIF